MKLEKMTIADVLQLPQYRTQLNAILDELRILRYKEKRAGATAAHPIDKLIDSELWNVKKFIPMFEAVMSRTLDTSASVRRIILQIGLEAFNKTMTKLVKPGTR